MLLSRHKTRLASDIIDAGFNGFKVNPCREKFVLKAFSYVQLIVCNDLHSNPNQLCNHGLHVTIHLVLHQLLRRKAEHMHVESQSMLTK